MATSEATPPTHRRWFQFSLGTMLWLILTAALAIYGVSEHWRRIRAEKAYQLSLDVLKHSTEQFESLTKMQEENNRLFGEMEKLERATNDPPSTQ
jgi:hypothetical protein